MTVLLTGGAGYIGSHTAVELLQNGCDIVVADDYSNSSPVALQRVKAITGRDFPVYAADVTDPAAVRRIFAEQAIDCVIHFAGKKAVGESVEVPLAYYRTNLDAVLTVLECMRESGVSRFIFSSSATVYGSRNPIPYREEMPRGQCSSPYGSTKAMIEQMLEDLCRADSGFSAVLLRYFNPIGAHPSGLIGEDPLGIPNNLMPFIAQVAVGRRERLTVFGGDYPTPDGTCRRDFIHVMDLAAGHRLAAEYAMEHTGAAAINLGTGRPYSVREVIAAFEQASGCAVLRSSWAPAVRATCRNSGRMPAKPKGCWAGGRGTVCRKCAAIPGAGSSRIRRAIPGSRPAACVGQSHKKGTPCSRSLFCISVIPPSRFWPGCGVYPRRSRAPRRRPAQSAAG